MGGDDWGACGIGTLARPGAPTRPVGGFAGGCGGVGGCGDAGGVGRAVPYTDAEARPVVGGFTGGGGWQLVGMSPDGGTGRALP